MKTNDQIPIPKSDIVKEWADIVIERWIRKISRLKIGNTNSLLKSFRHSVSNDANGDPAKVSFAFNYYGRFVDMGVGRGVRIDQVDQSNRKPKPWYSKTFINECNRLAQILADQYGKAAANSIKIIESKSIVKF